MNLKLTSVCEKFILFDVVSFTTKSIKKYDNTTGEPVV